MTDANTLPTRSERARIVPRPGPRPRTSRTTPHTQLEQNAPAPVQRLLWSRMVALPNVTPGPSLIAGGRTRALHLDRSVAHGPVGAFAPDGGTEFAHLHGLHDGSLHLNLPVDLAEEVIAAGWGEYHPVVLAGWEPRTLVMVYGPRDEAEVETVMGLVRISRAFGAGVPYDDADLPR